MKRQTKPKKKFKTRFSRNRPTKKFAGTKQNRIKQTVRRIGRLTIANTTMNKLYQRTMFRHSLGGAFALSPKDFRYSLISMIVAVCLFLPSSAGAKDVKERTFCSSGFATHVNLDCWPRVVHILSAEKGMMAGGVNAITCDATNGRQVQPIKAKVCQNLASPVCNNAYLLPKGGFVHIRYQVNYHWFWHVH